MMDFPHYHAKHRENFKPDGLGHKCFHCLLALRHAIWFTVAGLPTILAYEWIIAPNVHLTHPETLGVIHQNLPFL